MASVEAANQALEILDKLGMIDGLLLRLKSNPDLAHKKLRVVLLEIRKTCEAIANSINEIDQLSFEKADLDDTHHQIRKIVQGPLKIDLQIAKGNCGRIDHIYRTYLCGWFSQVLDTQEADALRFIFNDLGSMDGHVLHLAEQMYFETLDLARRIDDNLTNKQVAEAEKVATDFTQKYRPCLSKLNDWLAFMFSLDNKLIKTSRIS
jgi:hypothetical protein